MRSLHVHLILALISAKYVNELIVDRLTFPVFIFVFQPITRSKYQKVAIQNIKFVASLQKKDNLIFQKS